MTVLVCPSFLQLCRHVFPFSLVRETSEPPHSYIPQRMRYSWRTWASRHRIVSCELYTDRMLWSLWLAWRNLIPPPPSFYP